MKVCFQNVCKKTNSIFTICMQKQRLWLAKLFWTNSGWYIPSSGLTVLPEALGWWWQGIGRASGLEQTSHKCSSLYRDHIPQLEGQYGGKAKLCSQSVRATDAQSTWVKRNWASSFTSLTGMKSSQIQVERGISKYTYKIIELTFLGFFFLKEGLIVL